MWYTQQYQVIYFLKKNSFFHSTMNFHVVRVLFRPDAIVNSNPLFGFQKNLILCSSDKNFHLIKSLFIIKNSPFQALRCRMAMGNFSHNSSLNRVEVKFSSWTCLQAVIPFIIYYFYHISIIILYYFYLIYLHYFYKKCWCNLVFY